MGFLEVETPFFGWGSQLNHSFLSVLLSLCAPYPYLASGFGIIKPQLFDKKYVEKIG